MFGKRNSKNVKAKNFRRIYKKATLSTHNLNKGRKKIGLLLR